MIVEKDIEGLQIGPKENKLGIRGSDTHSLMFTDVKVPKENRIGEDGFGFKFYMKTLSGGRIGIASQALGIASGAYELALQYSKERKAFGKPISEHQGDWIQVGRYGNGNRCCKITLFRAAWMKDNGLNYDKEGAMAKVFASETAMKTTTEAVQFMVVMAL